jgi:hypothetical protein
LVRGRSTVQSCAAAPREAKRSKASATSQLPCPPLLDREQRPNKRAALGENQGTKFSGCSPSVRPARPKRSHIWEREKDGHYVEPRWCSARLFDVEGFAGAIWDPCCGFGRVIESARAHGLKAVASDIVDRGFRGTKVRDFFSCGRPLAPNIVTNPNFAIWQKLVEHALRIGCVKIATLISLQRLPAAHWLQRMPFVRIWLLTPRPSMPPGDYIARGEKPEGAQQEACWLIFERGHVGPPVNWLHRDGGEL